MTARINEISVSGTEYVRCNEVHIVNPYGKVPSITFGQEKVTIFGADKILIEQSASAVLSFDPEMEIQLRDPLTDQLLGTSITFGDVYQILYSAYRQVV